MTRVPKFWKEHSLSIVIISIFVVMLIASWPLGKHSWDGKSPYYLYWLSETIFSLEADVGGMILIVLFTKWFREKGSSEDKNND